MHTYVQYKCTQYDRCTIGVLLQRILNLMRDKLIFEHLQRNSSANGFKNVLFRISCNTLYIMLYGTGSDRKLKLI